MDIAEQVYETLLNTLDADYMLPWVDPVFVPENPCYKAYSDMHQIYEKIRIRLGVTDEDLDIEKMIDCLLLHGRLLALEMFRYGILYEKMQNDKNPDA